jgi:preprotein translocase subunit SecE
MSSQRQSVIKARPVPAPSRSEAARPPKPTIERERPGEAARGPLAAKIEQVKRMWLDTYAELRKVTWPDKETTKNLTIVVIAVSAALGAMLGAIDWVMQRLFELI